MNLNITTCIALLSWLSFGLAIASYLSGSLAIMKGSAQPSIISRVFWLALSITNTLSYFKLGAGSGIYFALAIVLGSFAIFLLSLRYGYIEFKRSDIFTIMGACAALLCYLFVGDKLISLTAGLMTHFIGGIPTYKKTWTNPYAENLLFWFFFAVSSACSVLAVVLQGSNVIYPLYVLLFDAGMCLLIVLQRQRPLSLAT